MAKKNEVTVKLPESYAITKSTPGMRDRLRELFTNNKGKLFTVTDLQRITGKKWINGFLFYTTRARLAADAPCDFPLTAIKKGRAVVGYRYQPAVNETDKENGVKYRNTKGHVVKPSNVIGKWEAKPTQRAINAAAAAATEAAVIAAVAATETAPAEQAAA